MSFQADAVLDLDHNKIKMMGDWRELFFSERMISL